MGNGRDLFDEIIDILGRAGIELPESVIEGLIGELREDKLRGKAPVHEGVKGWPVHRINSIPGSPGHGCHMTLVVRCYNKDNLWNYLHKMMYHAGIICRGQNKQVVFFTTKWDPTLYEDHREAVESIRREGVRICFVLISESGASHIPA